MTTLLPFDIIEEIAFRCDYATLNSLRRLDSTCHEIAIAHLARYKIVSLMKFILIYIYDRTEMYCNHHYLINYDVKMPLQDHHRRLFREDFHDDHMYYCFSLDKAEDYLEMSLLPQGYTIKLIDNRHWSDIVTRDDGPLRASDLLNCIRRYCRQLKDGEIIARFDVTVDSNKTIQIQLVLDRPKREQLGNNLLLCSNVNKYAYCDGVIDMRYTLGLCEGCHKYNYKIRKLFH